jgi:hypothetical protein
MNTKIQLQLAKRDLKTKENLKIISNKKSFVINDSKNDLNKIAGKKKQEDLMTRISQMAADELNTIKVK